MSPNLSQPWASFLGELDGLLDERFEFHCIGGFAAVVAYNLPRSTNDLDYFTLTPHNRMRDVERLAGQDSPLARKHRVHVHRAAVASLPDDYESRLKELYPGRFTNIRLCVPDPYDLVLSKLSRNSDVDRQDVKHLATELHLDPNVLRDRYVRELRAIQIGDVKERDQALEFWIEAYFSKS
ncbi:MAG TPA: DUF6036 family nucleotidyltransferase [Candidatus Acidoferrales bacterium]|nr:DUF6036 family nucleotidyltransferase [Candidatus Acidoferrales bacterium]